MQRSATAVYVLVIKRAVPARAPATLTPLKMRLSRKHAIASGKVSVRFFSIFDSIIVAFRIHCIDRTFC